MCKFKYAPMVKWLRRRPLTAESGVRVPLGVPYKVLSDFFYVFKKYLFAIGWIKC